MKTGVMSDSKLAAAALISWARATTPVPSIASKLHSEAREKWITAIQGDFSVMNEVVSEMLLIALILGVCAFLMHALT